MHKENRSFRIGLLNGNLVSNDQSIESGVSSRVFKDGSWGFASNAEINDNSIDRVISSSNDNASFLNQKTTNKCGILLEGSSVTATSASLGVSDNSALELARTYSL